MFFFLDCIVCEALTLSRVVVPSYKYAGDSAVLECPYELGRIQRDRLYAVKWYFNNEEFYRYVPKYTPPIYTHKIDGIKVQVSKDFTQFSTFVLCFMYNVCIVDYRRESLYWYFKIWLKHLEIWLKNGLDWIKF